MASSLKQILRSEAGGAVLTPFLLGEPSVRTLQAAAATFTNHRSSPLDAGKSSGSLRRTSRVVSTPKRQSNTPPR
jgi:hypothetical protein